MLNKAPIWIVQSDNRTADMLRRALEQVGLSNPLHEVSLANMHSSAAALEAQDKFPLFCIVDGAMAKTIGPMKANPSFAQLPVVILQDSHTQRTEALDSTLYWSRPLTTEEWIHLMAPLREFLLGMEQRLPV